MGRLYISFLPLYKTYNCHTQQYGEVSFLPLLRMNFLFQTPFTFHVNTDVIIS